MPVRLIEVTVLNRTVSAVVAALIAVAVGAFGVAPAGAVTTKDVAVIDLEFVPRNIAVMPADSARWTYSNGNAPHNVVFEDGGFSEPASPTFAVWTRTRTFASTGTYRYYCAAHGGPGGVGMAGVVIVNETGNIPPSAVLTAAPSPVDVNGTVNFSAAGSADLDGTITKYEWDLDGDGTYEVESATTATTSRSYSTVGTRNARLRVTDNVGASTVSDVRAVVVTNAPTASFSLSPNPAASGQVVSFDASASTDTDGTIVKYEWDLDANGTYETNSGTTPTTSKSYTGPTTLMVKLRVTDNVGFSTTTTRSLEVQAPVPAPLPPAALSAPAPPPAVAPPPPAVGVAASVNCSTLTGTARAACMQKACRSLTGTKKATCINNSCRYLKATKRASCIQTSCRYVAKSKRASCGRSSCRYLPAAGRRSCLRRYAPPARRR